MTDLLWAAFGLILKHFLAFNAVIRHVADWFGLWFITLKQRLKKKNSKEKFKEIFFFQNQDC